MKEPANAIPAADQRKAPTLSFKIKSAKNIANTGLRKLIEIASGTAINVTAANIQVTPIHPKTERIK